MPKDAALRIALLAIVFVLGPACAGAQPEPVPTPPSVPALLSTLAMSPDQPNGYEASVALHVRLRIFPFIRMTLHGTSTYRRPGLYRFVFRGMPLAARAFSDMKYDLGDPLRWPDRYEIAFAPESTPAHPVLRLTPKQAMLVRTLDVTIDPDRGHILRATWSRTDGGTITLVQTYASGLAGRVVVEKQDAAIDLPRMKASLEADYADFRFSDTAAAAPR